MGQTANLGFPFPDGGEIAGASAISNLANALDSHLNDMESTQNPTMITLECINGWTAVTGGNVAPIRLYRMGRFIVMQGEVIWYPQSGVSAGQDVPNDKRQFVSIPAGWRPAVRIRTLAVRTSTAQTEMYIDQYNDGIAYLIDPVCLSATPGYSIHSFWIAE